MIKRIKIAENFWSKFKGLMFRDELALDEAILLLNCSRVHTCFMKFDICVIYLDEDFNMIEYEILKPWNVGKKVRGTKHILEASSGIGSYVDKMNKITIKVEGEYDE